MKIGHFSYSDIVGGAYRAAYRIHHALREAGIDSTMHAVRPTSGDPTVSTPPGELFKATSLIRPRIGAVPKLLFNTGNAIVHSPALLSSGWPRRINQSDTDIAHLHWVNREMLSVGDIGRIKKPIVWTLHDMWAFCGAEHYTDDTRYRDGYTRTNRPAHESGFDLNRWTWNRKRRAWRRAMHIVTPSHWLGDCAKQSELMGEWPITVIPNALDTRTWQPVEQPVARQLLGLPVDGPLLAFGATGGGRDPRKGSDLLFAALNHLRGQILGLELMVFGERRPTQAPDVGFPVHYLGHLYDDLSLKVVYSAADVMVVPSRQEAFGLTAAEAQACGTPVIAFDTSGLPDMVKHQHTGWLAKAFDTEDLARGIQWVLASDDRREELACHAREDAVARFSYPVVAKAYKAVYEQVLGMEQHDEPT